ncbi:MAG: DUF6702 family protein [Calditrichia bacterium]
MTTFIFHRFLILAMLVGLFFPALGHDYYVSFCQINHNPEAQTLEITLKMYTDDLETALANRGHEQLFIGTDKESPAADSLAFEYILEHLRLSVNGDSVGISVIGKEVELDVFYGYLEVQQIQTVSEIKLTHTLLLDSFDSQQNMVRIRANNAEKTTLLNSKQMSDSLVF